MVSTPMRATVASARRTRHLAMHPHRERQPEQRAIPARSSAVAFTPPTIVTTMANRAGWRQLPDRSARWVSPMQPGQPGPREQQDRETGRVLEHEGLSM